MQISIVLMMDEYIYANMKNRELSDNRNVHKQQADAVG